MGCNGTLEGVSVPWLEGKRTLVEGAVSRNGSTDNKAQSSLWLSAACWQCGQAVLCWGRGQDCRCHEGWVEDIPRDGGHSISTGMHSVFKQQIE